MRNVDAGVNVRVYGEYRTIIRRGDGGIEVGEWRNSIYADFLTALKNSLAIPQDYALDTLFAAVASPPTDGKDGIIVFDGVSWYSMVSTLGDGVPTYSKKVTGVITGVTGTFTDACLGCGYVNAANFDVNIAGATLNNIVLASSDTLTIEWTISFS